MIKKESLNISENETIIQSLLDLSKQIKDQVRIRELAKERQNILKEDLYAHEIRNAEYVCQYEEVIINFQKK